MAAPSASPQLQLVTCAILLLALFITIAASADIFLDWHVTFDFNVKPVSTDQPVEIVVFDLFICLIVSAMHIVA